MRYLLAFLFPPLALLSVGRPLSAIASLLLLLLGLAAAVSLSVFGLVLLPALLPLTFHAVLVIQQEDADERHRQLMAALKAAVPPRRVDEWQVVIVTVLFVLAAGGIIAALSSGLAAGSMAIEAPPWIKQMLGR